MNNRMLDLSKSYKCQTKKLVKIIKINKIETNNHFGIVLPGLKNLKNFLIKFSHRYVLIMKNEIALKKKRNKDQKPRSKTYYRLQLNIRIQN
ncbi:hypothetical protein BpHYR1_022555 [Brachionus plicatilis]|uniref:Uncharacterized protein n=1 Tax=Brachionus plicatilis TaxID=10195 RepID=A0A3M7PX30_BRAPC|nr:hypothetical protein BpHYR1_022555 [Brachionus plicatilis]